MTESKNMNPIFQKEIDAQGDNAPYTWVLVEPNQKTKNSFLYGYEEIADAIADAIAISIEGKHNINAREILTLNLPKEQLSAIWDAMNAKGEFISPRRLEEYHHPKFDRRELFEKNQEKADQQHTR